MHAQRKLARLAAILSSVQSESVERLEGLFKQPGERGYNADAEKPPEEWGPRTRCALVWATSTEEGKARIIRALQRWPSVQKMLPRARKRTLNVTKSHEATGPAPAAKLS